MRNTKFPVVRLRHTVTFGNEGNTGERNPNTGEMITGFVPGKTVHCGNYTIAVAHALSLDGPSMENTISLAVRHNEELSDVKRYPEAKYKGDLYDVVGWSIDDELHALDIVTLKKNEHN